MLRATRFFVITNILKPPSAEPQKKKYFIIHISKFSGFLQNQNNAIDHDASITGTWVQSV